MPKIAKPLGPCSFDGCPKGQHCKGLCKAHYEQQWRGYELRPLLETVTRICHVEGCDRDVYAVRDGLCHCCYTRRRRGWIGEDLSVNPELTKRHCEFCGKEFTPKRTRTAKCCSERCYMKNARLLGTYGLRGVDVRDMLAMQDGKCAICLRALIFDSGVNDINALHVDHCHSTGAVRGLLCGPCNRGLGLFNDDIAKLRKAADYLER